MCLAKFTSNFIDTLRKMGVVFDAQREGRRSRMTRTQLPSQKASSATGLKKTHGRGHAGKWDPRSLYHLNGGGAGTSRLVGHGSREASGLGTDTAQLFKLRARGTADRYNPIRCGCHKSIHFRSRRAGGCRSHACPRRHLFLAPLGQPQCGLDSPHR